MMASLDDDLVEVSDQSIQNECNIFEPPPPGSPPHPDHALDEFSSASALRLSQFNLSSMVGSLGSTGDEAARPEISKDPKVRKIMVPWDPSLHSERAFDWALQHLVKDGDEIVMFHVLNSDHAVSLKKQDQKNGTHELPQFLDNFAHSIYAKYREKLLLYPEFRTAKLIVDVKFGELHREHLVEFAENIEATMIVMGCRGLSKLESLFVGSLSAYCVANSKIPVIVIRDDRE
ncbi:uncharacterized protein BJ171DRAFT_153872 [Polychytrium aggregatum]|uniref:uncharacterized protein n=1 Tax=Polychytrium aggregatum TaxID=110093 RepID=UPI0022FE7E3F|nr:uncharacterized protein BJ171DRAFT_153872 [Polychytrium aggregatum]KAI9203149.1 hypothetical protein BJ171DRAFT_153872 [Polychytrium aggregatum]